MARSLKAVEPKEAKPSKPKILIFGKPGVGKTWGALDFPSVYYIDTEGGANLAHYTAKLHASGGLYMGPGEGANDFSAVTEEIITLATTTHRFRTLVIDSYSKIFGTQVSIELERIQARQEAKGEAGKETYGAEKKPAVNWTRRWLRWFEKLDMNVILICHQRDRYQDGKLTGVTFDGWDKLEYDLHLCLNITKQGASRKARVVKSRSGRVPRRRSLRLVLRVIRCQVRARGHRGPGGGDGYVHPRAGSAVRRAAGGGQGRCQGPGQVGGQRRPRGSLARRPPEAAGLPSQTAAEAGRVTTPYTTKHYIIPNDEREPMKFQPKTEEQLQRESLLEPGIYDFEVQSAEDTTSSAGNDMIATTLKVFRPDGGHILVNDWLLEKMAFKLIHFCRTTGLDAIYDSGDLAAQHCLGRSGKVLLIIKQDPGYAPKNAVKDYHAPKEAPKGMGKDAPVAVRQAAVMKDDEPPF